MAARVKALDLWLALATPAGAIKLTRTLGGRPDLRPQHVSFL